MARRYLKIAAFGAAYLALWVTYDLSRSTRHDLRRFDPHEVARIETAMWHSYYDHRPVKLFVELSTLLRRQFELPFWRSCQGAYYAARSAVVFQKGRQRAEYLRALPDLVDYYGLIRGSSVTAFDTQRWRSWNWSGGSRIGRRRAVCHRHLPNFRRQCTASRRPTSPNTRVFGPRRCCCGTAEGTGAGSGSCWTGRGRPCTMRSILRSDLRYARRLLRKSS